jgi:hypothetical protein
MLACKHTCPTIDTRVFFSGPKRKSDILKVIKKKKKKKKANTEKI